MISTDHREALDFLEAKGAIDPRYVLWWQKGFEGRRIYSEEEFSRKSTVVNYTVSFGYDFESLREPRIMTHPVWPHDDVPVLIREYNFLGRKIPFFVTMKPMSHDNNEGWRDLERFQRPIENFSGFPDTGEPPLQFNVQPHIRGVVVEDARDFLFWFPLQRSLSEIPNLFTELDIGCMFMPIHPERFYENLHFIEGGKLNRLESSEIVPYYKFDPRSDQVTVYPAPVFEDKLDVPILLKGHPGNGRPQILGIGKFNIRRQMNKTISYQGLNPKKIKMVERSLIDRLGKI